MKILNLRQQSHQEGTAIKKIIWFNPPYSVHVKRNIGRIFLQLIDKHFPRHHNYRKLFNRNGIKICNSLHENMANVIRNHNTSLLKEPFPTDIKECICRRKPECPQDKKRLSQCQVYKASADRLGTNETKLYYGTCEKNFKESYKNTLLMVVLICFLYFIVYRRTHVFETLW